MKYVIHKFFTIGQFEKEEKWLNEMSAKGMQLTDVGFCRYCFTKGNPGEYIYRLELLNHMPHHAESINYISFLEETGIEHIGSLLRWVYFRKKAGAGPFEIYSDTPSKINHYRRILFIANILTVVFIIPFISYVFHLVMKTLETKQHYDQFDSFFIQQLSPYLGFSLYYFILLLFVQIVVIPIRKSLYRLKKERAVHE